MSSPAQSPHNNPHNSSPYTEDAGAFTAELQRAVDLAGFALRAVARRRKLALFVAFATFAAVAAGTVIMPRMYRIDVRILTHKAYILPALVSPRRSVPLQADAPTRGAVELIKAREMLLAIIRDAKVKESWEETRSIVGQAKDFARELVKGPMEDGDFEEALIEMLDQRLLAYIDGDVVVMQVEWHNPSVAMALAQATKAQFLQRKQDAELSEVRETLRILETNLEGARRTMEAAGDELATVLSAERGGSDRPAPVRMRSIRVRRPVAAPPANQVEKRTRLQRDLAQVNAQMETADRAYQRRLDEANRALNALRQSLGPQHPDVQNAIRVVEERSRVPPELQQLRVARAEIESDLKSVERSLSTGGGDSYDTIQVPDNRAVVEAARTAGVEMNPDIERADQALQGRILRYNEFVIRLEDARTELATANAAFDYRYIVTMPPLFPKRHVRPNVPVLLGLGVFLGMFLALASCLAFDVFSRRVLEPWQVESATGVPVLGTMDVDRSRLRSTGSKAA
jgi:uncharacterized protein involved in exopolysaccharide biosynthesis